jgi:uncharacterized membrane protein (UPF0127 family)
MPAVLISVPPMPIPFRLAALPRALVALAAGLMLVACAAADETRLTLVTEAGQSHAFSVEVVDTPESRSRGLMYRTDLADDAGMLFDFFTDQAVSFWMMNTFIPLDMIFVSNDGVIRSIHANARPHDRTGIPSGAPVRFVLEIPGGRAAALGIRPGDRMQHPRVGRAPPPGAR